MGNTLFSYLCCCCATVDEDYHNTLKNTSEDADFCKMTRPERIVFVSTRRSSKKPSIISVPKTASVKNPIVTSGSTVCV